MFKKICGGMRFISLFTIIITAIVIFSASYHIFGLRIKNEIDKDALNIASLLDENNIDFSDLDRLLNDKSVFVLSKSNEVIYFSDCKELFRDNKDINKLSSVENARNNGVGDSEQYANGILKKMYSKSVKLTDGKIITVAALTLDVTSILTEILVVMFLVVVLVNLLSAIISKHLTENIVAPIEEGLPDEIDEENFPYEEFKPFIRKISYQNLEIKRQMERVKRQKLRLQAVSESMNEGLVVLDREGGILSVNDSAMKFFGTSGKEKYTKTSIMSLTGNDADFADNIIKALHNERGSFRYERAGKSFEIFYSPVTDEDRILGVIILMFDITERLKNEQIRAEFTANVSHELKTPLTTIHGFAQLLSGGLAKTEDVTNFASKIEKESGRLINLVEDIIELSNLDEGATGKNVNIDMYAIVTEISDTLRINAEKRGITVKVYGDTFNVYGDGKGIHELIYNIVDNAVKYNVDNGKVDITVSDGVVTIADTGIGIPEEYKERIFERFFRVDKSHSKNVNGTGLGLSIVKHIAKNNGIRIEVDSELGRGSVFKLYFS